MRLWIVVVALLLASCAGMSKVGPGEVTIRETLAAKLDAGWNRFDGPGMGKLEMWTAEGFSLDTLRFFVDIQDGEPLAEQRGANEKQVPRFRSAMQPTEIVEMFDAFSSHGGNAFKLGRLAPATFLGTAGFRFDYTLVRKGDEVELKGFGYGAVRNGRLTLMVFQAPKIHYYPRLAPRAEAVAASARVVKSGS